MFIRAFIKAVRMTLRGEQPRTMQHPQLYAWIKEGAKLVDDVYDAAERAGLDRQAREKIALKIDGRKMSMETILGAVYHSHHLEMPHLLSTPGEHNITAIYAANLNDRYRVRCLHDALDKSPARAALARLSDHLEAIPKQ